MEGVGQLTPRGRFGLMNWGQRRGWRGPRSAGHSLTPGVEGRVLAGVGLGWALSWRNGAHYTAGHHKCVS